MHPISKLILGTVQFGLPYGINNAVGKIPFAEVNKILEKAAAEGIATLDTANAYGDAPASIGKFHQQHPVRFNIINKLQAKSDDLNVISVVEEGLQQLCIESFEAYLFHNYADFLSKPNVFAQLQDAKKRGLVKKIGVSIYTNEELNVLTSENKVDLVQLPYNMLDNEHIRGAAICKARQQGITIHTRTVFLQGLFFRPLSQLPEVVTPLQPYLQKLHALAQTENMSMAQMALGYVLQNPSIDGVLIGVDSVAQLEENIRCAKLPLSPAVVEQINSIFVKETELLNPLSWL